MKRRNRLDFKGMLGLMGILSVLTLVVFMSGCTSTQNSTEDYMASSQKVQVNELYNNPDQYTGMVLNVTGIVVAKSDDSKQLLLSVGDPTSTFSTDVLPVYVNFANSTNATLDDDITVYGEFYVNGTFGSSTIMSSTFDPTIYEILDSNKLNGKKIPWINATYVVNMGSATQNFVNNIPKYGN